MGKEVKFTCDKCGSNSVKAEHERYDEVWDRHKDYDTLDFYVNDLVSYKERYNCHCLDCGYKFTEY